MTREEGRKITVAPTIFYSPSVRVCFAENIPVFWAYRARSVFVWELAAAHEISIILRITIFLKFSFWHAIHHEIMKFLFIYLP